MQVFPAFQAADVTGDQVQFLVGDLSRAEGWHLGPGISHLANDHLRVVARQAGSDGGAFTVLPVAGGASLGNEKIMTGRGTGAR